MQLTLLVFALLTILGFSTNPCIQNYCRSQIVMCSIDDSHPSCSQILTQCHNKYKHDNTRVAFCIGASKNSDAADYLKCCLKNGCEFDPLTTFQQSLKKNTLNLNVDLQE